MSNNPHDRHQQTVLQMIDDYSRITQQFNAFEQAFHRIQGEFNRFNQQFNGQIISLLSSYQYRTPSQEQPAIETIEQPHIIKHEVQSSDTQGQTKPETQRPDGRSISEAEQPYNNESEVHTSDTQSHTPSDAESTDYSSISESQSIDYSSISRSESVPLDTETENEHDADISSYKKEYIFCVSCIKKWRNLHRAGVENEKLPDCKWGGGIGAQKKCEYCNHKKVPCDIPLKNVDDDEGKNLEIQPQLNDGEQNNRAVQATPVKQTHQQQPRDPLQRQVHITKESSEG
ncbi:hypothetical protein P170DRAFT_462309 [Aspergillus steynii IBT 23096]|uniref:Uncharacterized protein n=1 Tax=Aspergillus steynii IBT 23096 TaxID=1392250 RepID=A0A2I2GHJ2_9EURO|nr:uncharacterized protein P170DRAFT_462309 [Aspergillus steynii IBT 23096]PLB52339.1 hypothetical protein P170DRAFT_462309 [Aspergillus steynii IBT 23096]